MSGGGGGAPALQEAAAAAAANPPVRSPPPADHHFMSASHVMALHEVFPSCTHLACASASVNDALTSTVAKPEEKVAGWVVQHSSTRSRLYPPGRRPVRTLVPPWDTV